MSTAPHVVVIGAGPVGLTAAAYLARRQMAFTVLEAGDAVGASIRQWRHVRLFSPWAMDIDPDAANLLRTGYEQVRSVVAALAGDLDAASRVRLILPETAACSLGNRPAEPAQPSPATVGCCG